MPVNWMDSPHQADGAIDPDLLAVVVAAVTTALSQKQAPSLTPRQSSEIVALLYEEATASGEVDEVYLLRLLGLFAKDKETG